MSQHLNSTPLGRAFMEAATRYPEATAIEVGNRSWTYEEVAGRVEATHLLLREAGVALGDRIGIWMDRSSEAIVGVLAAWSLGSAYVPLSPETLNPGLQTHFPLSRLARMFDDIAPRVVLTDTDAAIPGWDGKWTRRVPFEDPACTEISLHPNTPAQLQSQWPSPAV